MATWQQNIIDNSHDLIVLMTLDGLVRHINPSGQQALGNGANVIGRSFLDFVQDDYREKMNAIMQDVVAGRHDTHDVVLMCGEGSVWVYSIHCFPLRDGDTVTGLQVIARDVTQRYSKESQLVKETERKELAIMELQEANQIKSEFISSTSHELRTPLNSIIGFLGILRDKLTVSPEEEQEVIANALNSGTHLLGLINDILDIAKIEAGRMSITNAPVSLLNLLDEVMVLMRVQAKQKFLTLEVDATVDSMPAVTADYGKLKQVVINIMSNAIKFTDKGGITLETSLGDDGAYVTLRIRDTGIGIDARDVRMVFQKFSQVDSSFTRTTRGTGLGLNISRGLMELMGGPFRY